MGIIDSIDRSDSIVTLVTTFIHFIHINFITQGAICIFFRPGQSQWLLYKHLSNRFINWLAQSPPLTLSRRQAQTVRDGAYSYTMDYVTQL